MRLGPSYKTQQFAELNKHALRDPENILSTYSKANLSKLQKQLLTRFVSPTTIIGSCNIVADCIRTVNLSFGQYVH